jgi:prevent-host-death family protein
MHMSESVGIAELRQNLNVYLRRVSRGERLVVTDGSRRIAAPMTGGHLDRLIAAGRVSPPAGLPESLELLGDPRVLSRALDDIRGYR